MQGAVHWFRYPRRRAQGRESFRLLSWDRSRGQCRLLQRPVPRLKIRCLGRCHGQSRYLRPIRQARVYPLPKETSPARRGCLLQELLGRIPADSTRSLLYLRRCRRLTKAEREPSPRPSHPRTQSLDFRCHVPRRLSCRSVEEVEARSQAIPSCLPARCATRLRSRRWPNPHPAGEARQCRQWTSRILRPSCLGRAHPPREHSPPQRWVEEARSFLPP